MSDQQNSSPLKPTVSRKWLSSFYKFVRRAHLYAGLFLLPWVFLYGITGALFNHQSLLPEVKLHSVSPEKTLGSPLDDFPSPAALAEAVTMELQKAAPESDIQLLSEPQAAYNNEMIFKVPQSEGHLTVHINPTTKQARVAEHSPNPESEQRLLADIKNIQLSENPYQLGRASVAKILEQAGFDSTSSVQPQGWCKLNYLAEIDGEPARITYVLRDGHIDANRYDGNDGMSPRQFFMRMHTTHGQPPSWNGRMAWSLILDAMAIAMVSWAITGIVMWWQLKRLRRIGGIVILASLCLAVYLYFSLEHFYATTRL